MLCLSLAFSSTVGQPNLQEELVAVSLLYLLFCCLEGVARLFMLFFTHLHKLSVSVNFFRTVLQIEKIRPKNSLF